MNIRKHQELMDFWEYSHNFDSEDEAFSIDEDITFEASQQELQIELEHFNEMDLEQELHPIKDDDFQPKDEHPNKTMLKRELQFPFTMEELSFLSRHEEEIPATMEKLDKEKLALLKEIGVVVRRIAREQERLAKEKAEKRKKNNRTNRKKEV